MTKFWMEFEVDASEEELAMFADLVMQLIKQEDIFDTSEIENLILDGIVYKTI